MHFRSCGSANCEGVEGNGVFGRRKDGEEGEVDADFNEGEGLGMLKVEWGV